MGNLVVKLLGILIIWVFYEKLKKVSEAHHEGLLQITRLNTVFKLTRLVIPLIYQSYVCQEFWNGLNKKWTGSVFSVQKSSCNFGSQKQDLISV